MASDTYHEPLELLSAETKEMHRAVVSLIEELEAIDWYTQRAEASSNNELRATLIHNRNEEIEHACMTLEWIRRNHPQFDAHLRTYLFSTGSITEKEEEATGNGASPAGASVSDSSLGIGSLKESK
jgi:ferritin-like protein